MFKVLRPTKDAYITDRYVDGAPQVSSNVGAAGSLDLMKLYGYNVSGSSPVTELTRLLVQFDLSALRTAVALGQVDLNHPSFSCHLYLYDVYGGQPTPSNFTVNVYPLSQSFDEGLGRDVVMYSDHDVCNWLTGSLASGSWHVSGCGLGGGATQACDYITASAGLSTVASQLFVDGTEDLNVDVTSIVSATLAGALPDAGFRVSYTSTIEADTHTYFVKRFAGRTAYNSDVRPRLLVRYDGSIQDDTTTPYLDAANYLFLYNYVRSAPANLVSGSSSIVGKNSLVLRLVARSVVSGTNQPYSLVFSASQHFSGINPVTGLYSASMTVSSTDPNLVQELAASGSVTLTPVWGSLDGTLSFLTASSVSFLPPQRGATSLGPRQLNVTTVGIPETLGTTVTPTVRVNVFDYTTPIFQARRLPVDVPGAVVRDAHYQVRDAVSNGVAVPFDTVTNSTRLSSDAAGMFFVLDTSNLTPEHSYVIDVMTVVAGNQQLYKAASPVFRVSDLR